VGLHHRAGRMRRWVKFKCFDAYVTLTLVIDNPKLMVELIGCGY